MYAGQVFAYLIVIDFESTCWKNKKNVGQEISKCYHQIVVVSLYKAKKRKFLWWPQVKFLYIWAFQIIFFKYKIWVHFFFSEKMKKHPIWQKLSAFPTLNLFQILFLEMGVSLWAAQEFFSWPNGRFIEDAACG